MLVEDSAPAPVLVALSTLPVGAGFVSIAGKHYAKGDSSNNCFCFEDQIVAQLAANLQVEARSFVKVVFAA